MYSKPTSLAGKALIALLSVVGAWLCLRYLLPWTAPLLLAFASSVAIEPAVKALCRRMPRSAAAGLCVIGFLLVLGAALWFLFSRLASELSHLGSHLPEAAAALSASISRWQTRFFTLVDGLPDALAEVLASALTGLADYLSTLPAALSARAVELLSGFVSNLPTWLLFAVTWLMGLYFISAAYPSLVAFVRRQIPTKAFERLRRVKHDLQQSLGKYIKAQLIMSAITLGEMLIVFALLRINYALVLAIAVALIDALPVFGAGTVLLPWAAWELLAGDPTRGLGLAISYAASTVLRSCIQAKLLGDQLGLHPIATLLAIYAGWKAMGIWGMILFPIAAISLKKLNDGGIIHLWKGSDTNDRNNLQHSGRYGHEHTGRNEYPSR